MPARLESMAARGAGRQTRASPDFNRQPPAPSHAWIVFIFRPPVGIGF